jgi:putative DNA primase/helicase
LLALRNGILDLKNNTLLLHTDELFTRNALNFDYDPNAPTPTRFFQFLEDVWPEGAERDCHAALKQMFGYLLAPDTSHQKIFVLVGPPRSGKGTIGRLLKSMLGPSNICSPTFSSMGTPFGK